MAQGILWAFVGICGLLGVIGVISPNGFRRITRTVNKKAPLRIIGVLMMVAGALVYRTAVREHMPPIVKGAGVFLFMLGGVELLLPSFLVVFNDWWASLRNIWQRFAGLVFLAFAGLFYLAMRSATLTEVIEQVVEDVVSAGGSLT